MKGRPFEAAFLCGAALASVACLAVFCALESSKPGAFLCLVAGSALGYGCERLRPGAGGPFTFAEERLEMGQPMLVTVKLVEETCCNCGTPFAIESALLAAFKKDHARSFTCPNGHSQHYIGQTEAERERARAVRAEEVAAQNRRLYEGERLESERLRKVQGKLKKRIANGVCPCCHRSFIALKRHMDTKHPDYK